MAIEPTEAAIPSEAVLEKDKPIDAASSSSNKSDAPDSNEKSAVVVDSQYEEASSSSSNSDVFDIKAIDPVLARKMALVNTAIDEIGMTSFQWRLFWLNGFGYAVDSVWNCTTLNQLLFNNSVFCKLTFASYDFMM